MDRYAIVDDTGAVLNVTIWDGVTEWEPPASTTVVLVQPGDIAEPGGTYADGVFTRAPVPEPPATEEEQEQLLAVITNALLTVPEVQQALTTAGVVVEVDEKGNPIGVKVPVADETGEVVVDEIVNP